MQVGIQASTWVSVGAQIGDEVEVRVEEAHPRDDVLSLKEVISWQRFIENRNVAAEKSRGVFSQVRLIEKYSS